MNPIIKEAIENIKKHMDLSEGEEMFLISEIGQAMIKVATGCKTNPDFNLKGGDDADENSNIPPTNFHVYKL